MRDASAVVAILPPMHHHPPPVWTHIPWIDQRAHFEGSEGVHKLIKEMGDAWCKKQLLATGRPPGDGEKSMTTGLLRRRLSTAIVKANISVLLSRTSMMGEGARMARGRRQWGRMEEMKAKNEREAAWRAATTGKEVVRRGQF